ncbi:vitrin-like isoform X8 [Myxocyprinus asiaticus]|uniref:vitrin-like isoform X8 n=1 Tax=Myxocyprinus asiaticus TaxID=70543 RepID=UPI002223B9D4|nr:vitrin-like isoform X8 [Myxocyprinus asiaticus]
MIKPHLTAVFIAILLTCCGAKPNGKNKKPKLVVPAIECDVRAGKINLPEFIAKCPANCRETKERVYGTSVFASISSICNAAIHSGVISNSGGKVIVRKMDGQASYKGSFANGVRSLSLTSWRESFSVSVGKPNKGVIYPSSLEYTPSRPTIVKTASSDSTVFPGTTAPEPTTTMTTTAPPTITPVTTPTTTAPPTTTSAKPRVTVHKFREAGVQRPDTGAVIRRQPHVPSASALARRDWLHPAYARPDWFFGTRKPTDTSHSLPNTGHKWSRMSSGESVRDPRPDNTEHEHLLYNYGQYSPESDDNKPMSETSHTKETLVESWEPESNPFKSRFSARGEDSTARVTEIMSQGNPNCKVDMAFLMDGSWSIGKRRFKIQKDFLAEVSQVINVGVVGPLMGIIQYGDDAVTEFSLRQFSNSKDLKSAINKIVQKGGASNIGKALSYINKHFFSDANGNRGGAPNVAVVLVDGWPTDNVEEASRLARESGINIFFVTIEGPDENEKQNVVEANFVDKAVCRTNGFFSLPITSWFALRKAVQPLVKRVCDIDRLVCSKTCLNANDIAFVIDGSSSVGTGNFRTVLQFVANVTREFEISDTDTRVGMVQYTYEQRLEFAFGQHNNKADLLNAIKRINYWSGGTSTGAAITYAADQLFGKSKPNKRKIMIVITDGRSYDDVRAPALTVHRKGVIAYSVGIAWAAQDELEYIATDPDREHSFFVDEFDNLYKYVSKIIHNICQEFNSQPRN